MEQDRRSTLIAAFDAMIPMDFQEATLRDLYASFRFADQVCRSIFPVDEFYRETIAELRRTIFAQRWIATAGRFGISAAPVPNAADNCVHARIGRPGEICWTASLVDHPRQLVRPSIFRHDYAQQSQADLFEVLEDVDLSRLYALLLYGADRTRNAVERKIEPTFAWVAFPDRDLTMYFTKFNLDERFPHVAKAPVRHAEEHVDDDLVHRIRDEVRRKAAEG